MAASASITMTTHAHLSSKLPSSTPDVAVLRVCARMPLRMPSVGMAHLFEHPSTPIATHKGGIARVVAAAVSQEEAQAAAAAVDEEEEETAAESGKDGGEEVEAPPAAEAVTQDTSTKLYFGNLPYNCDSAQLAGIIQEYASPEMVEVLYERDTGRSRGFAFVTMSTIEDCELVVQNLDGSQYGGRTLRVNFADKPRPKVPLYPETEFKLFVGNLSWSVTSETLTRTFQQCGNVVGARVLFDGETGRSRGYGFVCYSTKEEMDAALDTLDGAELEGRTMRVSLALGKRS